MASRLTVIHNPYAGPDEGPDEEDIIRVFAPRRRIDQVATSGDQVSSRTRVAVRDGVDRVVVTGGDGPVGAAGQSHVRSDVEVAILPTGTRNHYPRDAGIPLKRDHAARLAARGHARLASIPFILAQALAGRLGQPYLTQLKEAALTIDVRERRVRVALDSEIHERAPPLDFSCSPRALRVVKPGPEVPS